jgi:hypothetical protein
VIGAYGDPSAVTTPGPGRRDFPPLFAAKAATVLRSRHMRQLSRPEASEGTLSAQHFYYEKGALLWTLTAAPPFHNKRVAVL